MEERSGQIRQSGARPPGEGGEWVGGGGERERPLSRSIDPFDHQPKGRERERERLKRAGRGVFRDCRLRYT